jgi:hypothetical protein
MVSAADPLRPPVLVKWESVQLDRNKGWRTKEGGHMASGEGYYLWVPSSPPLKTVINKYKTSELKFRVGGGKISLEYR